MLARKQPRRAIIRTPEIKKAVENHKGRTNDKNVSFYFFCYQQLRSLQSSTDSASYLLTIFLHKKDTTQKRLYISISIFLLGRITRIYNTSIYKRFARVFSLPRNWSRWKKWLPAERTSRFGPPLTKNANGALSEKDGCMKKCQSTQKQPVFWDF